MFPIRRSLPLFPSAEAALFLFFSWLLCQSAFTGAFAYEFSFLIGIAVALIIPGGLSYRMAMISRSRPVGRADIARSFASSLFLLVLSLAVVFLHSGKIKTCRYDIGAIWFFLLPTISAIFATASALWSVRRPGSVCRIVFRAYLPTFLFSLLTFRDLIFDLPLSFLHPAFGYYPGSLYDEWIPIITPIITYRFWVVAISLWLVWPANSTPRLRSACGLLLLGCLFFRGPLHWFHSTLSIRSELEGVIESPRIRLYFHPEKLTDAQARKALGILSQRAVSVAREIGLKEENLPRVDVYAFASGDQKQRLTGLRDTAIGNPWQRAVQLPANIDWSSTLVLHELVHVIAAPYGIPGIGLTFRVGLLEGLATALEKYRGSLSLHEWGHAMLKLGLLPNMAEALSAQGFWREPPSRAYVASGSLCRWLIDRYGIWKFVRIYRGRPFEEVYRASANDLVKEWERFLKGVPLSDEALHVAETSLKTRAVFDRPCPHDVAAAIERGYRCQYSGNWNCAADQFREAMNYGGETPAHVIPLGCAEAKLNRWESVRELSGFLRRDSDLSPTQRAWGDLLLGDAEVAADNLENARKAYGRENPSELQSNIRWLLLGRLALMDKSDLPNLKNFISDNAWEAVAKTILSRPAEARFESLYLYFAQKASGQNKSDLASLALQRLLEIPNRRWDSERLEITARAAEKLGDLHRAELAYDEIERLATTEGKRLYARDQLDRIRSSLSR